MKIHVFVCILVCAWSVGCAASASNSATPAADTAAGADTSSSGDSAGQAETAPSDTAATDSAAADAASGDAATSETAAPAGTWAEASVVLAAKCATCHVGKALFYDATVCSEAAGRAAIMKVHVTSGFMPQAPKPKLPDNEKAKILAWLDAGAKCP